MNEYEQGCWRSTRNQISDWKDELEWMLRRHTLTAEQRLTALDEIWRIENLLKRA